MSVLLVHADAVWAAKNGHVVGDIGGVKPNGYARPPRGPRTETLWACYVLVSAPDLSEGEIRSTHCFDGVPGHLQREAREAVREWAKRREPHLEAAKRHIRRVWADTTARIAERRKRLTAAHEAFEASGLADPSPKAKFDRVMKLASDIQRATRRCESDAHDLEKKIRAQADAQAGELDRRHFIDHEKYPRRLRHLDLSKLPAPDADGVIRTDAATIRAATVTKGGER